MKVYGDLKGFVKNPDEFIKDNTQKTIWYSMALKVLSFIVLAFSWTHFALAPPTLLGSSALFIASLYIDYKILSNVNQLVFLIFQRGFNNPYKSGYYFGRICASLFKPGFIVERARGFFNGFKDEITS